MEIRLEWDEAKNLTNQRKHGISFETAARVFADPLTFYMQDRIEDGEERWQAVGIVEGYLLLVVAHTVQEEAAERSSLEFVEIIRIISARKADRSERRRYENDNR